MTEGIKKSVATQLVSEILHLIQTSIPKIVRLKTITTRLHRLEERFGLQSETEFDRRLRARIEAGRRHVAEARTGEGYAEPAREDLSGLTVEEILLRGRLRARQA